MQIFEKEIYIEADRMGGGRGLGGGVIILLYK